MNAHKETGNKEQDDFAPLLFKVLVDGKPCHGGMGKYPKVGEWTDSKCPLCCTSGWHLEKK